MADCFVVTVKLQTEKQYSTFTNAMLYHVDHCHDAMMLDCYDQSREDADQRQGRLKGAHNNLGSVSTI